MKKEIEKKLNKRNKYLKRYQKNWDKKTGKYKISEPKEIDKLSKEIYQHLSVNNQKLPVDFIIETLTKLGFDPSILYDDNGNFAISSGGMSSISLEPNDCELIFYVEKKFWKPTIRKAIKIYFKEN